jgi:hypothetical protein
MDAPGILTAMANPRRRTARVGARGAKPGVTRIAVARVRVTTVSVADRLVVLAED